MDVKLYVWKSAHGVWFIITENADNKFMFMIPAGDEANVMRLRNRGVPVKVF